MFLSQQKKQKLLFIFVILIVTCITGNAQNADHKQPTWWFGESGAVNLNYYRGTTQVLNNNLTVPTAFHKGNGTRPYASFLTEYKPNKTWGGMLNIAFDNRGGKFDSVMTPCNCPAKLSTNISYINFEPSIRVNPFSTSGFYLFAGPTISINITKQFIYNQYKQTDVNADWSDIRKTVLSFQGGAGVDIPLSAKTASTQMILAPFASFQTDLGQAPRSVESWSFYTIRAGVALKFGTTGRGANKKTTLENGKNTTDTLYITKTVNTASAAAIKEIQFSVRAPKLVPLQREVEEVLPLLSAVFFDQSTSDIPARYDRLTTAQAVAFNETQLQSDYPGYLDNGRSARQLVVYHNILNILGDRMRADESSTISLTGSSGKTLAEGKEMADNIRQYLVTAFGINPARISTDSREKPFIPSEQPGGVKQLALLREGDRRVDIATTSPQLLLQVGGNAYALLKPVHIKAIQKDPLDSHVIFTVSGAAELLNTWSIDATDELGNVQHYGPYTQDQASVPGKNMLGNNKQGNYKIVLIAETKNGDQFKKENFVSLVQKDEPAPAGVRYSILFNFDKSKTIAENEAFLKEVIAPMIPDNATVIIHGHTDYIGNEKYNLNLSRERAAGIQQVLSTAIANAGKKGIKFETYGFGETPGIAPFENNLPEERFYNRTVIIDIIPGK